jgi:hypothetical protein
LFTQLRSDRTLLIDLSAAGPGAPELHWQVEPRMLGRISRRRTVHQLTDELTFPLYKPGREALTVNVVVYVPRQRERAELALSVDGGEPQLRTGVVGARLSVSDRSYTIDAHAAYDDRDRAVDRRISTRIVDLEARRGPALDVVTLQVTLGEDVAAGPHQVNVRLLDGGLVWVRAFHRGIADRRRAATSWTEARMEDR